jgi:hypothetical protein
MKFYLHAAVLTFVAIASLPHSVAAQGQTAAAPTVVELFTSQSCYSCPPAEKLLGELAQRDDIIALEHHVDYWDQLVYGSAGRWKDIFSGNAATITTLRAADILSRRKWYLTVRPKPSVTANAMSAARSPKRKRIPANA